MMSSSPKFFDMRSLLAARLLALNGKRSTQKFLEAKKQEWKKKGISLFDRRLMGLIP